ncbi:MAG: hypothetical protein DDT30_01486 [Dehalococcoidia bacterium]|nr:hypothetical protein [Bacillota bacterium]
MSKELIRQILDYSQADQTELLYMVRLNFSTWEGIQP